jgi:aspartate aminotransferase
MKISQTLYAKKIKKERLRNNQVVFDGGLGENPLPVPRVLKDVLIEHLDEKEYTDSRGIQELQNILGERLLVGNGLKPLLFNIQLAFSKLYDNGIIYHLIPYWVSYTEQTNILNINSKKIIPKNHVNWKITPEDLENELSKCNTPNLIIFNNPTNPTGCYYTREEVKDLSEVFKKYNSIVVADDIYEKIIHYDHQDKFGQIKDYYELVISGSSLSKMVELGVIDLAGLFLIHIN